MRKILHVTLTASEVNQILNDRFKLGLTEENTKLEASHGYLKIYKIED